MFTGLNAFTQHEKSCVKGKKHLSGALSRAKEAYQSKKVRIQGPVDSDPAGVLEANQPAESRQLVLRHAPEFQAGTEVRVQHFSQHSN